MCFVRKGLDYIFTQEELKWLDDIMPETHRRAKDEEEKKKKEEEQTEVSRTSSGKLHNRAEVSLHVQPSCQ
jgi:hypothetical protein